jgi:transcriptional regulator with XRE-family HTH domain
MRRSPRTPTREVWMHVKDPGKLRRRRKDKGYSQTDLALLVNCTQQYISMLENGTDSDCSERIAERICKRLGVDLEDYFEERTLVRNPGVATPSRGGSAA